MAFVSESPSKPDLRMSAHSRGGGPRAPVASSSTNANATSRPVGGPPRAEAELLVGRPRGVAQLLVADLGAGGCAVPKGQRDALVYNCKV